jgi:hypothetical protein
MSSSVPPPSRDTISAIEAIHASTAHYSSDRVADELIDRTAITASDQIFDPSCGDAALLARAIERHPPSTLTDALRFQGWEIHPGATQEARENIAATLVRLGHNRNRASSAAQAMIRTADALLEPWPEAHVIIANPPYLRRAKVPSVFQALYDEALDRVGRNDLMHAFLLKIAQHLDGRPERRAALITSDRWLLNETAAPLRARMEGMIGGYNIKRDLLPSPFRRPKSRVSGSPPRVHPVFLTLKPNPGPASLAIGTSSATNLPTLSDIASVRLAPWLGPDGVFILNTAAANALRSPTTRVVPVVDTNDVVEHNSTLFAMPRRSAVVADADQPPDARLRSHLNVTADRLPSKCRSRRAWWRPPENPDGIDISQEAILIPRIIKIMRPIRLSAGILPINHGLHVVAQTERCDLDTIRAILTHPDSQSWIECHAPPLEDGWLDLRTTMLRKLPIPEAFHDRIKPCDAARALAA